MFKHVLPMGTNQKTDQVIAVLILDKDNKDQRVHANLSGPLCVAGRVGCTACSQPVIESERFVGFSWARFTQHQG